MLSIPPDLTTLDESVLRKLEETFAGESSLQELVTLFLEDGEIRLTRAREGQQSGNISVLKQATHSLRGSASMIGASRLRSAAAQFEQRLAADERGDLAICVDVLEQEFARARTALMALTQARADTDTTPQS